MNEGEVNELESESRQGIGTNLVLGALLIIIGLIFLIGQIFGSFFRIDLGAFSWPFFIIVPGVALFLVSLTMEPNSGRSLAILGSILTSVGLLLFFQNTTDLWATWAYAWALVAPTSVGISDIIYGTVRGRREWVRSGFNAAAVGIGIFLVGAFFFEVLIGLSGFPIRLGAAFWPLILIGLGVVLLISNLIRGRRS
jgi:hypothetical protein